MAISWLLRRKGLLGRPWATQFAGQVTPDAQSVRYCEYKRIVARSLTVGIADAEMEVDGKKIYEGKDLKVGLFQEGQL